MLTLRRGRVVLMSILLTLDESFMTIMELIDALCEKVWGHLLNIAASREAG
jgi:hypothetical protein